MSRIIEETRIDRMRRKCRTDSDRIVAYLWSIYPDYAATHESRETPFGWIGSAGDVRVRELARNDCTEHLRGKVESKPGREIGKDPRFEFFRFRRVQPFTNADRLRMFDEYPCQCRAPEPCIRH